jgi:hypothetical protein
MVGNNEVEDHSHVNYLVHFATMAAEPGFDSLSFGDPGFIGIEYPHSGGIPKDDRVCLGGGANQLAIPEKGITLNEFSLWRDLCEVCSLLWILTSFVRAGDTSSKGEKNVKTNDKVVSLFKFTLSRTATVSIKRL